MFYAQPSNNPSLYAQPINNPSRVPAYHQVLKVVGFCDFQVKPSNIGEGLVRVDVSWFVLCAREERNSLAEFTLQKYRNNELRSKIQGSIW